MVAALRSSSSVGVGAGGAYSGGVRGGGGGADLEAAIEEERRLLRELKLKLANGY